MSDTKKPGKPLNQSSQQNMMKERPGPTGSTAMPTESRGTIVFSRKAAAKEDKLTLEETSHKPRTRQALYNELTKDERAATDEDYYEFAPFSQRGVSLVIDSAFAYFLVKTAIFSAPVLITVVHMFLERYRLELWFSENILREVLIYGESFFMFFFLVIIPVAFFNTSVGKKIMQLRVRGDNKYTLSISQAFQRELIYKPLGMLILVGFFMPFFDKKKKSLHDKMTRTFVIKD